ncbi:serine/threonine-protein kinase [Plesiocystis pacifica]|nr:serine/threonine-protein kinase [Plesiocystis pacifica]
MNDDTNPLRQANLATDGPGSRGSGDESCGEDFETRRIVASLERALLGRGELVRIGDYEVRELLGEGGMGVVYRCHHDSLQRDVAIKLVKSRARANERDRLLGEAQALARLSHENVVGVYDWGEHEGQPYIVMEYVDGQTLRERVSALEPLSWRAIVHDFVEAGRGLAAAHAHGLVHRDFKPENVLVNHDGRVCVADFGLAIAGTLALEREFTETARGSTDEFATSSGAIAGTPAYMSPEQLRGQRVDERSDQFSFCVALYEALWERSPFPGVTEPQRAQARREGRVVTPPDKRALFRVIARGLSPEPAQRWPSMEALIDALQAISTRRKRWRRALAFAGAACSTFVMGAFLSHEPVNTCESTPSPWSEQTRASIRLRAAAKPEYAGAWNSLDAGLTQWSERWTQRRHELCEVEGGSENACLEHQRIWVDTIVVSLRGAETRALPLLVDVVDELPDPDACIPSATALSADREARTRAAWRNTSESHVQRLRGHHQEARVFAREAVRQAQGLDDVGLLARSRGQLAKAEQEGGSVQEARRLYELSAEEARAAGLVVIAADLELQGLELSLRQANVNLDEVESALELLAKDIHSRRHAPMAAHVEFLRGRIAAKRGDWGQANVHYDRALQLVGKHSLAVPVYWSAKASVASESEVLELSARARDEAVARFGAMHPRTARYQYNLGLALGPTPEGRKERSDAEHIWRLFPQAPLAYLALTELAEQALVEGDPEAAKRLAAKAIARFEDTNPSEGADYAELLQLLAKAETGMGELGLAMELAKLAVRAYEDSDSTFGPGILECHLIIIDNALSLERHDQAATAIEALLAQHGEDPRVRELVGLRKAELSVRRGAFQAARDQLERIELVTNDHPLRHLSVELLRLVVDLRLGQSTSAAITSFHERLDATKDPVVREALEGWLDELPVSAEEREVLGM